ncbi:MAG: sigma-70 family RNA polymerase sigma factor [Jaaginema sp. PMC 1079.18]|nr:sigma-70 family RNA polymerase sigma factor [Jaaginema sp. PMC 1080.18]MEC4850067.1 sigma-70 family RNA polymerase sigma factor [Jaaginema sp. PMC 1079.18]MEC4864630.1 sigma-70 family RNA polymerase sigma factor [Jaaginema sp. PMC 1078.18]
MISQRFPECNHSSIKSLFHHSDRELLTLFQRHPEQGKYFTAIFCRYHPIVYTLISHTARSPVQADYLFALTWRHIFYEMRGLELRTEGGDSNSFQSWIINITALCINQIVLPPVESITYNLNDAAPPLWCYLEQALDTMPGIMRLIVLMAQTFHWSETRIAAYLQAEGERLSPAQVRELLAQGYQILEGRLPRDIRQIYLQEDPDTDTVVDRSEDLVLSDSI